MGQMRAYKKFIGEHLASIARIIEFRVLLPMGLIVPLVALLPGQGFRSSLKLFLTIVVIYIFLLTVVMIMLSVSYAIKLICVWLIRRSDPRWPHSQIPTRTRDLLDTAIRRPIHARKRWSKKP